MDAAAQAGLPATLPPATGTFAEVARLPLRQKMSLMVGLATAAAIVVGAWLWSQTPDYRVLFANMSDRDGGATLAALTQMNVPYKFSEGGGAILVPADKVHDTRLRLASQGLPKGGTVGFELVDNQKFGATQFQEQINYQRGLEGELARSIQSLSAVAGARVHIAIPKPSVFVRDQQLPSASVLVSLHPGKALDRAQVQGIVHLVASSVPELAVDRVDVLDQSGELLSRRRTAADAAIDPNALNYVRQIELATNQRIVEILEPIVGRGNVRVQVTADVDFNRTEAVAESYKPNGDPKAAALRNQQTRESTSGAGAGAQGVPGALSNQPPANATASPDKGGAAAASASTAGPTSASKESSANFEVDRTIEHRMAATGTIRRLTAAVVVNHRRVVDKDGKATATPIGAPEMEQIQALVREAMGFKKERGDSLNVVNAPFTEPESVPVVEVPMWKQPDNIALAKDVGRYTLFALLIAYLVFGVLKPALRRASEQAPAAMALPSSSDLPALPAAGTPDNEDPLAKARRIAREDPKIVANVVKAWVSNDE
jgi:flagellar M-ring protein FliF